VAFRDWSTASERISSTLFLPFLSSPDDDDDDDV
jgi:hypothetical protein